MSTDADEQAREKRLSGFLCFLDIAIRHGREAGLSDDYLVLGMKNRVGRGVGAPEAPPAEPGTIIARAREQGRPIRTFSEYKQFKQEVGLVTVGIGQPAEGPHAATAAELGAYLASLRRFRQRRQAGLIPPDVLEQAYAGGLPAFRAAVKEWGAADKVLPNQNLGGVA